MISGGAGLLGKEHAKAILSANGNVVLWDLNETALSRAVLELRSYFSDSKIQSFVIDVTKEDEILKGSDCLKEMGVKIQILINNVAANPNYSNSSDLNEFSRFENFGLNDWNSQISIGLTSAFLCSKIIGLRMVENGGGVILNISSDLSVIAPDQRLYQRESLTLCHSAKRGSCVALDKGKTIFQCNQVDANSHGQDCAQVNMKFSTKRNVRQ